MHSVTLPPRNIFEKFLGFGLKRRLEPPINNRPWSFLRTECGKGYTFHFVENHFASKSGFDMATFNVFALFPFYSEEYTDVQVTTFTLIWNCSNYCPKNVAVDFIINLVTGLVVTVHKVSSTRFCHFLIIALTKDEEMSSEWEMVLCIQPALQKTRHRKRGI